MPYLCIVHVGEGETSDRCGAGTWQRKPRSVFRHVPQAAGMSTFGVRQVIDNLSKSSASVPLIEFVSTLPANGKPR